MLYFFSICFLGGFALCSARPVTMVASPSNSFQFRPYRIEARKNEFLVFKKTNLLCDWSSKPSANRDGFFVFCPTPFNHVFFQVQRKLQNEMVVVDTDMKKNMPVLGAARKT